MRRPRCFAGERRRYAGLLLASLLAVACQGTSADRVSARTGEAQAGYVELDAELEPLRTAFNAASGKVRAVLLAAPT